VDITESEESSISSDESNDLGSGSIDESKTGKIEMD